MTSTYSGVNTPPPSVSEREIRRALLLAPRTLKCGWNGCPFAEETFGSIQALLQHVKLTHSSSLPIPSFSKNKQIPCKFAKNCKTMVATNDELYKHVEQQHLETVRSTCYLCTFQDRAPMTMLNHLRSRHLLQDADLVDRTFAQPPQLPSRGWSSAIKPLETYKYISPMVVAHPDADPDAEDQMASTVDYYDFLDEEERDAEQMSANAMFSNHKRKQQDQLDSDISFAIDHRPLVGDPTSTHAFHAGIRTYPENGIRLSNGFPYKHGQPLPVLQRPTVVGYFVSKDAFLPPS